MTLAERIDKLEDAHRALAAQHLALDTIARLMLPLIDADPALLRGMFLVAYDTSTALMQEHGHDAEFQSDVRRRLDLLSDAILEAADKRHRRPSQL